MWEYNYDYLEHHGIQGQKWGVRNGPPYPIEDKVLKKGTRVNSVSSKYSNSDSYKNNGRWMYTYNPDDTYDRDVYRGPFSKYLVLYRGAQYIKEHKYETTKDLRMPTRKERVDAFKHIYEKNKKDVIDDLKTLQRQLIDMNIGNEKERQEYRTIDLDNLKTDGDFKIAYNIFNHAMEATYAHKSTREYAKYMEKHYDAMVDDNNQGVYNDAHDPIIIFRANQVLKTVKDDSIESYMNSFLTNKDIIESTERIRNELAKKGERVKL